MHGILPVDKPSGWTSHDVVARVRRLSGQRRVGHAGTLDPMATGVLLVCLGEATRLSELLMDGAKWYLARIAFGVSTDTDDAEGRVVARGHASFNRADLLASAERLVGDLEQVPPAYAAIKQGGVPSYRRARQGIAVQLAPRAVTVHLLAILDEVSSVEDASVCADLLICCSKGTYIRALARDLGRDLGCGAHLAGLRRLASGGFTVRDCLDVTALAAGGEREAIVGALRPMDHGLPAADACLLDPHGVDRVLHGMFFAGPAHAASPLRVYDQEGDLLALAAPDQRGAGYWHPYRVFRRGE